MFNQFYLLFFKSLHRDDLECVAIKKAPGSVMLTVPGCLLPQQKVIGTSPLLSFKSLRSLPKMIIKLLLLLFYTHHEGSQLSSFRSQTENSSQPVPYCIFRMKRGLEKGANTGVDGHTHPCQWLGLFSVEKIGFHQLKQPWGKRACSSKGRQIWV